MAIEEDKFLCNQTTVDRQIRLKKKHGTKEELIEAFENDVQEWTEKEKQKLEGHFAFLEERINALDIDLRLTADIQLVKSTMVSEIGGVMGYTRGNSIFLSRNFVDISDGWQRSLLAHELFHIVSRNNPELRKKLYKIIGFTVMDREIELPDDLKDLMISNPDVERHDSYITLTIEDKPQKCMMIFYSSRADIVGAAFTYFEAGLALDDELKTICKEGKTLVYKPQEAVDLMDIVGRNTNYTIDPEEIMAENFNYLLMGKEDVPNPEILKEIQDILKK